MRFRTFCLTMTQAEVLCVKIVTALRHVRPNPARARSFSKVDFSYHCRKAFLSGGIGDGYDSLEVC